MSVGPSSSAMVPIQEAMWKMNLGGNEAVESGPYPQRPGDPDCAYYIRTGLCRFGMTCRYNHPPNRKLAIAAARIKGEYPERVGQPECQYYLKTGTCKYGATCKFHHPRDKAGIAGRVQLNILGYPVRPNEEECSYYLRTGLCKFGNTCKFHHPQPTNDMVSIRGSTVYSPGQQSYSGGVTNWPLSRGFVASPRWQGPSSYSQGPQLILPQGLVQLSSWNTFPASLGSISSPERQQQTTANAQGEKIFPERPEQPECQFYMKTGDCKFGAVCRFHHPKDRLLPAPNCLFSPLGLPLRPGEPICIFYSRYGICKFGPNCKFDHPVGTFMYGFPPSSALMQSSEGSSEAKQIPPSESPEDEEN